MSQYLNIINVLQAYPVPDFTVSEYFPLLGDTISLVNTSTDDDVFTWTLTDTNGIVTNSVSRSVDLVFSAAGLTSQSLQIGNTVGTETIVKYTYPLDTPELPYYEISVGTTVARVGETVPVTLVNKYNFTDPHTLTLKVIDHETQTVVQTIPSASVNENIVVNTRGIYDIEVEADYQGSVIANREGMILTITPALASRELALEHDLVPIYESIYGYSDKIVGDAIDPGTTIVLVRNEAFPENSTYRLEVSNLRGTPENPIIITIDRSTPLEFGFELYNGFNFKNCDNVILDGRGYQNLQYGISIFSSETNLNGEGIICIQGADGSTGLEVFAVELSDVEFAGIMWKTDPKPDYPEYWRPTFEVRDLRIHNTYIHNTGGEGLYLGYFDAGLKSGYDSNGVYQEYFAHKMVDTKVYRNKFYRCGWDSIQLNSAFGNTEIAYNEIIDNGFFGEFGQNTGMTLSLEGKVHNNTINGSSGIGIQFIPLGTVEMYNNVIYNLDSGINLLYLLGGGGNVPEVIQETVGNLKICTNDVQIYNNTLIANGKGNILSAQNVIQYENVTLRNNVLSYQETEDQSYLVRGMETATNYLVMENSGVVFSGGVPTTGSNNLNIRTIPPTQAQIADTESGNFNINIDSVLGYTAPDIRVGDYDYDIRGFKNWLIGDKHYGAYSTIVKTPTRPLVFNSVTINSGDATTSSSTLSITLSYTDATPDSYRISETGDFTGISYQAFTGSPISYNLADTALGVKTIYVQLLDNGTETQVLSDTIELVEPVATSILLDFGYDYRKAAGNWNHLTAITALTAATNPSSDTNLINSDGGATTIGVSLIDEFKALEDKQFQPLMVDGENIVIGDFIIPYNAASDSLSSIATAACSFKITGLDAGKTYTLEFYPARGYDTLSTIYSANGSAEVEVVNKDVTDSNRAQLLYTGIISDVAPDGSNEIVVTYRGKTDGGDIGSGYLSAMRIIPSV